MSIVITKYKEEYLPEMIYIWNEVVEDGIAFPQEELLDSVSGKTFFEGQTCSAAAFDTDTHEIVGLYILHPNNVGRCGHICNASFAVKRSARGNHIGRMLVEDCLIRGKECGFKILQFNAVVAANTAARRLYEGLGFKQLGTIPNGFHMKDGSYEDICPYYKELG